MRTQLLAALVAGGALLGGCYRMAVPAEQANRYGELTRATDQESLDVVGPRVDPRTRTSAVDAAGTIPDLAVKRAAAGTEPQEPERRPADEAVGIGGSGPQQ